MQNVECCGVSGPPETKIGPFSGGISAIIWLNLVQDGGIVRKARSVSLSARRCRDHKTGDWKDCPHYRIEDLPALLIAVQKALEYVHMNPLTEDG